MLVGKLASMSRREAEQLVRERGGLLVDRAGDEADLIVASDESADLQRLAANRELFDDELRARIASGDVELVGESELWARLGLVESGQASSDCTRRRCWPSWCTCRLRRFGSGSGAGAIVAKREVRRLAYFDFEEVRVARKLAQLLAAGCSLSAVNRKLEELARLLAGRGAAAGRSGGGRRGAATASCGAMRGWPSRAGSC